jgi:UDP-N-acetyl-D-glucosamine 4,6-dehydratase
VNLLRPTHFKRVSFFLVADGIISLMSFLLAYHLRFNFEIPGNFIEPMIGVFLVLFVLKVFFFYLLKVYMVVWRFFSLEDARKLLFAHFLAYGLFAVVMFQQFEIFSPFPRSVIGIDFVLSLFFLGSLRISKRFYLEQRSSLPIHSTVIIGVNTKTSQLIKGARNGEHGYFPAAILAIDDNKNSIHTYMNNIKVYGMDELSTVVEKYTPEAAIVTQELEPQVLNALYEKLYALGIQEVHKYKALEAGDGQIQPLSITDLLARYPKDLNPNVISTFIQGKRVLITGAGGSIGSEIARQAHAFGASKLLLLDHAEYNLYRILEELPEASTSLSSVTHRENLEEVFEGFKPDIVIHAVAYKHVPLCEANIQSALENNIQGTINVIDTSIKYAVEKLVIISTDKAVRPTNVMGATKRATELYAQNIESRQTEIVAVRFGNVLGSSGSVIPEFKYQIENGGPVTVTHPDMTRYFMLIPEACQLVLQAASIAKGGEIFILDMGEPVKIVDLAKKMIRLYGKEHEVKIEFSGLRPGEKLYEELLLDETEQKTKYDSIFITRPTPYDIQQLRNDIEELFRTEDKILALQKIVPEFERRKEERA